MKPRAISGLDPDRRLRPSARRILAVRIDEVYSFDEAVADPANVTELHDMRIACKRLRYLLEIFGVAFGDALGDFTDQVAALQDILGDIHDCDVQIPMLEDHLRWLDQREAGAARRLVSETAAARSPRRGKSSEAAFQRFQKDLEVGRRGDERIGIHALIGRRRRERADLYATFTREWRRRKEEGFRANLEAALGLPPEG